MSKINTSKDKVIFSGKFSKGIDKKVNTVAEVLTLLRNQSFIKDQSFKINIQKNIPHGSGLGGGSSNASNLLHYFNHKMKLKLKKKKMTNLAKKIGSDVPIVLERKNTFLTGEKDKILRISKKFNLNLLIVYPNIVCSTKKVYKKCRIDEDKKYQFYYNKKNKRKLIDYLKNENNDLEKIVVKIYPKIGQIINFIKFQKGCLFSRITGSGSACIGIFSNRRNVISAKKLIKLKYPNYWCVVSKTI